MVKDWTASWWGHLRRIPNKVWEIDGGQELCWKCKGKLDQVPLNVRDFLHCHHDPKEGLKCWCETRIRKCREYTVIQGYTVGVIFCPQCGKRL